MLRSRVACRVLLPFNQWSLQTTSRPRERKTNCYRRKWRPPCMTSRTCRSCFSRWTKAHKRENVCREWENIRKRKHIGGKKRTKEKNKCKQIAERRQREVNEKQIRRVSARALRMWWTPYITDKNAVFRLALYPPLRPSAVRVRACMHSSVCVCVCRVSICMHVTQDRLM